MRAADILEKINRLPNPQSGEFALMQVDNKENYYYGKNADGDTVFVIKADADRAKRLTQTTKDLRLDTNASNTFVMDGKSVVLKVHILTCSAKEAIKRLAFIRLFNALVQEDYGISQNDIVALFNALLSLFAGRLKCPTNEIQGLFAELYSMLYFESKGIDLYQYWQSEDRRTHDFCITNTKRVEVKSTSKDTRIHRFRHEQLLADLHDVKVISIFAKRVDKGLSLFDLIQRIRESSIVKYRVLMHIEQTIAGFAEEHLKETQFDEKLLEFTISIYEACSIPHFNEKQPNGVFNAEYDSDLTNVRKFAEKSFIDWIKSAEVNNDE